jgi:ribosome-associated protein
MKLDSLELAHTIVDSLENKKAEDIILLDIKDVASFTDYFVICSGSSNRMLQALVKDLKEDVRIKYNLKTKIEGGSLDGWMLADFGNVIVHVFSPQQRKYYDLEELWSEGKTILHLQ